MLLEKITRQDRGRDQSQGCDTHVDAVGVRSTVVKVDIESATPRRAYPLDFERPTEESGSEDRGVRHKIKLLVSIDLSQMGYLTSRFSIRWKTA